MVPRGGDPGLPPPAERSRDRAHPRGHRGEPGRGSTPTPGGEGSEPPSPGGESLGEPPRCNSAEGCRGCPPGESLGEPRGGDFWGAAQGNTPKPPRGRAGRTPGAPGLGCPLRRGGSGSSPGAGRCPSIPRTAPGLPAGPGGLLPSAERLLLPSGLGLTHTHTQTSPPAQQHLPFPLQFCPRPPPRCCFCCWGSSCSTSPCWCSSSSPPSSA